MPSLLRILTRDSLPLRSDGVVSSWATDSGNVTRPREDKCRREAPNRRLLLQEVHPVQATNKAAPKPRLCMSEARQPGRLTDPSMRDWAGCPPHLL